MSRTRRTLLVLVAMLALPVGSASAHVSVKSTSPGAGTTASTSLRAVSVTFTGRVLAGSLSVHNVRGRKVSRGRGARDPRNTSRVRVGLERKLKAGRYTVRWRIIASDGHHQSGSYAIRLRKPRR